MRDSSTEVERPFGGLASPFCDLTCLVLVGFEGESACKTPIAGSIPAVALVDKKSKMDSSNWLVHFVLFPVLKRCKRVLMPKNMGVFGRCWA